MSYVGGLSAGLAANDVVVMAAERRYSLGTFIASKTGVRKLVPVADHIALAATGIPADVQFLARIMSVQAELYRLENDRLISCKAAAKLLSNYLYSTRLSFPKYVEPLMGGFDSQPRLVMLDVAGSINEEQYAVTGTGARIALGVLEEGFTEEMDKKMARSLVLRAINAGIHRDTASGDHIDLVIVEKDEMKVEEIKINDRSASD
ncbi:MAG: proteasome subunit beta [Candidatus Hodarchaeales archaeon]|jgi:proteasome beta subunit